MNGDFDPVETEILKNALESLVDEMAMTILRTAYSNNLKNSMDFSTALCQPSGELIAQGLTLPLHLGSVPHAMQSIFATFGDDIRPGDIYLLNDPYAGGTHLPDFYIFKPVFLDGVLACYLVTIAHHADVGGMVAGGNGCDATEIFQEGIRIPPLKLYDAGVPNESVFKLIRANVRVPRLVLGDIRAQLSACHVGERRVTPLFGRYGHEDLQASVFRRCSTTRNGWRDRPLPICPMESTRLPTILTTTGLTRGRSPSPLPCGCTETL